MSENPIIVLATKNHPLYEDLKKASVMFCDPELEEPFERKRGNYLKAQAILDFTLQSSDKKEALIRYLSMEFQAPIISDLTLYWGEKLFVKYPNLKGAIGAAFYSPKNCYEFFSQNQELTDLMAKVMGEIGHQIISVDRPGLGFTYPRVISMIINEAYIAKDDRLASEDDIDRAMKFGVNYPLGPFAWAREIGTWKIVHLLDELFKVYQDPRYRVAPSLRLEAFQ